MEIQFQGSLYEHLYKSTFRQATLPQLFRGIGILALLFGALWLISPNGFTVQMQVIAAIALLFPLLFFLFGGRATWSALPPSLRTPVHGTLSAYGVRWNSELHEARYQWGAFTHYYEKRDLLTLYMGTMSMMPLPRAFFASDADWEAAQALVRENIPM